MRLTRTINITFAFGVLISAVSWGVIFLSEDIISWEGALFHIFSGIGLASVLIFTGDAVRPWSFASFALCSLSFASLVLWNVASAGNFFSRLTWGDPLHWRLLWTLVRFDPSVRHAIVEELISLYTVLGGGTLLFVFFLAVRSTLQASKIMNLGRTVIVTGSVLGCTVPFLLFNQSSVNLKGEPLAAFFFGWPSRIDLGGVDSFRREAELIDNHVRQTYSLGTAKPTSNVVIIVLDSLRSDHLPMYGYGRDTTPFLSSLVRQGALQQVEWAFSTCSESFCGIASILTGHPFHKISLNSLKIYELLKVAGYRINLIVSGEHEVFAELGRFYDPTVIDTKFSFRHSSNKNPEDDLTVLEGLKALPRFSGQPNFFFFFLMSSHVGGTKWEDFHVFNPSDVSALKPLWNRFHVEQVFSKAGVAPDIREALINNYDNGLLQADWVVQRIFSELRSKEYLNDAIVVITGDHGDSLSEKSHLGHTLSLDQVDIGVPLLVWDSAGTTLRNSFVASHIDVVPTILDRLGMPFPGTLSGTSLYKDDPSYSSIHQTRRGTRPCAAAVERRNNRLYKLIACSNGGDMQEALYELTTDPREERNLLGQVDNELFSSLKGKLSMIYGEVANSCSRFDCVDPEKL